MTQEQPEHPTNDRVVETAQQVLIEAGRVLSESIHYETTLQKVASLLVPALGDWCVVDLIQGDRLVPVAAMHTDPRKVRLVHDLRRRDPLTLNDPAGAARAIRTGNAELYEEATDPSLEQGGHDQEHWELLRALKMRSGVIVPLAAWGRRLGAITLASEEPGYYGHSILPWIEELGRRCGLTIDYARSYQDLQRELTEHRKTQRSLRESEERYRTLFESIDEGFCIIEMLFDDEQKPVDWRFIEMNSAFESHTGVAEALGRTAREILPDIEEHWFETYGRVALTGEPTRFVDRSQAMDRWFDVYAFRVGEPQERKVAVLFSDITERKQAEEERERLLGEVRAERRRLAEIFQYAPSFMCILRGPQHVFERANDLYLQLVGHRELIGKPVREVLPEIEGQGFFELLDHVYETGEAYVGTGISVVLKRQSSSGELESRWIDFVYQPLRDAEGSVTGIFVQGVDLTERKKAEDALRATEQQFRAIFDQAAVGVAQTDTEGRFLMINDRYCRITGHPREELIGSSPDQITHPDDVASTREAVRRLARGESPSVSIEKRYVRQDGSVTWGRVHMSAIKEEEGRLACLVGVVEDIDEQKRAQQRMQMEHVVSQALAVNETFEEAIPVMLRGLCEGLESEVAELWLLEKSGQVLRCHSSHLHNSEPGFERFLRESQTYRFAAGEGLPGRVWSTGEPVWIVEIQADGNFPRADLAVEGGLRTGMAFPIRTGEEFVGALCFYSSRPMAADRALMETMVTVGNECGQFIRRRRAEQATEASELRKSAILESSLECLMTMDAEGRIVDFNPAAERTFGYQREEVVGRFLADLVIPERLRERHWRGLNRYLETGEGAVLGRRVEMPAMRADGSEFPVELTITVTYLDGVPFFTGYLRDITETKRTREQLEVRARQQAAVAELGQKALAGTDLQALFDEAVQVIADILDNDLCKVLRLLPGGEELQLEAGVGWKSGLVGKGRVGAGQNSQAGYTLMSDQPVVVTDLREETRFHGPPLLHEHGVVSGMSVIIAGDGGQPWGVLGTHTRQRRDYSSDDVNFLQAMANILATAIHRKTVEGRLRSLNETLEERVAERTAEAERRAAQLQAMAGELTQAEQRERRRLAGILHDHLQQLLAAGKMQANMLTKRVSEPDAQLAIEQIQELLSESIAMSRNLTMELDPPILHEAGLVAALRWLSRWMTEKHQMTVDLQVAEEIELNDEDLRILLFHAIRELLFNTAKYAGVTQAQLELGRVDENTLEVKVNDQGSGFAPDQVGKRQSGGGGFGLFSIRERLELMGGRMEIQSFPGQGTSVTLRVPLHRQGESMDWQSDMRGGKAE